MDVAVVVVAAVAEEEVSEREEEMAEEPHLSSEAALTWVRRAKR